MPGWQVPGVPSMPTPGDLMRIMQLQTELLTELPETLSELTRAVRGLAESVETSKETVAMANRVVERLEALVDDLHDPVRALRPGIERVSEVLDAPVVQRLPEVLEAVESTIMPITRATERVRATFAKIGKPRQGRSADQRRHL